MFNLLEKKYKISAGMMNRLLTMTTVISVFYRMMVK